MLWRLIAKVVLVEGILLLSSSSLLSSIPRWSVKFVYWSAAFLLMYPKPRISLCIFWRCFWRACGGTIISKEENIFESPPFIPQLSELNYTMKTTVCSMNFCGTLQWLRWFINFRKQCIRGSDLHTLVLVLAECIFRYKTQLSDFPWYLISFLLQL